MNESSTGKIGSEGNIDEGQTDEISDTETDFQLVADKMEELNSMKVRFMRDSLLISCHSSPIENKNKKIL